MKKLTIQTVSIKAPIIRGLKKGPKSRFTLEQIKFLEENIRDKPFAETAILFNNRFGTDFTRAQIKYFCKKNGIKNGLHLKWTPEIEEYIKKNYYKVLTNRELTSKINARFKTEFTLRATYRFTSKIGLKKGNKNNFYPVGSERIDTRGYIETKIAMHGPGALWVKKHRLVWEQNNGKIPTGMNIIFLDYNPLNCALENLAMISDAENTTLSHLGLRSDNPEITLTGIAIVKHLLATHKRLEKILGKKGHKNFINNESRKRVQERNKKILEKMQEENKQ
jgi:hypothetical protein